MADKIAVQVCYATPLREYYRDLEVEQGATIEQAIVQSGVLDPQTRTVLSAFQMKYRPADIAGNLDAETASLLEVLTTPANAPLPVVVPPPAVTSPVPPLPPATPAVPVVPETAPAPAAPLPVPSPAVPVPVPVPAGAPVPATMPVVPAAPVAAAVPNTP